MPAAALSLLAVPAVAQTEVDPSALLVPEVLGSAYHVPSFVLVDAMARVDWENWRLSVNASNLTDKNYLAACSGPANCAYGVGRTVFATLAYSW